MSPKARMSDWRLRQGWEQGLIVWPPYGERAVREAQAIIKHAEHPAPGAPQCEHAPIAHGMPGVRMAGATRQALAEALAAFIAAPIQ
jgi:hypothetical protein